MCRLILTSLLWSCLDWLSRQSGCCINVTFSLGWGCSGRWPWLVPPPAELINPLWLFRFSTHSSSTMGDSFIIAIDFGTAFSGYAFNVTPSQEQIDPHLKMWGEEVGLQTPKTPTCILFDEHEEFVSFGYEAKQVYLRMCGEDARTHFFFEHFKMSLYGKVSKTDLIITRLLLDHSSSLHVYVCVFSVCAENCSSPNKPHTVQQTSHSPTYHRESFHTTL